MIGRRIFGAGVCAAILAGLASPCLALPDQASPQIERQYRNCEFGQLHVRVARPAKHASEQPPLILLHQTALSGRMFDRFMPFMASDRLVIAVDTPGYGESDRPASRPTLAQYGDCIVDALAADHGGQFDILGYHTGAAIAADVAARRPEIRRTILVSMPYFEGERRQSLISQLGRDRSEESEYADDGSHLLPMWQGSFGARAAGQSVDDIARLVAEKQRAGRYGHWALQSALEDDLTSTLAAIEGPVLIIAPHDGLQEESRSAAATISGARIVELPEVAYGLFDSIPERLSSTINPFLED